jgi:hypothetical protein
VTRANPEKIEPNSVEEETVVEQHDIPKEEVAFHSLRTYRSETAPSQEATETKPDPGKMQSVEEHQEIPKEDATVMPVRGLRKQRRDRNPAAGRRQKPKRRIRASCEPRRRLTVASKKITRCATVAWRKRNIFRKIVTQGNCGPRSKLTAAGIKMTRHAGVAWPKENIVTKDRARNQAEQETQKRRKEEKEGLWKFQECNSDIRDQCRRRPLRLRNKGTTSGIYKRAIVLKIAKQVVVTPSWLRKLRKLTLWRGQPPPKRKKSRVQGKSREMWDHRPLHEL